MIALAACTHAPATTPAPAAPGVISNVAPGATPTHEPLATIERSGCFGWCPIYEATVFRDGMVEYRGERFVKTTGAATWTIEPREIVAIETLFAEAHYLDLKDAYTSYDVTDMPSAVTSHTRAGRTKRVAHYAGDGSAPKALGHLESELDRLVHIEKGIGTEAEREKLSGR